MKRNARKFRLVMTTLTLVALLLSVFGAVPMQAATPIYVRPDGDDSTCDGTADEASPGTVLGVCAFKTIQKGIDLVDDGGTVNVANGTYTEQLSITAKGLTITGESESGVIVQAAAAQTDGGNTFTISAAGKTVTIQNMTIRHGDYGIRSTAGDVNVLRCTLYHNGWDGTGLPNPDTAPLGDFVTFFATKATNGGAIRIENSTSSEIAYCTIYENDRGIRYQDGDNGNIHHNVSRDNIQSGIYLSSSDYCDDDSTGEPEGSTNTVVHHNESYANMNNGLLSIGGKNNVFHDNEVDDNWNSGVMLWCPAEITVENNVIGGNNIYSFNGQGVPGDDEAGVWAQGGPIQSGASFMFKLLGNTISNNLEGGTASVEAIGVRVGSTLPAGAIEIKNNTLSGHDIEVYVESQAGTTLVNYNKFVGSTTGTGIKNDDTGTDVDGEYNWWGAADGPSSVGSGSGDGVSADVDYTPWLTSAWVTLDDFEGGSGLEWFYMNRPGDGWHEGGFDQDPKDTSGDAKTPLDIVTDPDLGTNSVLAWEFDGSKPNGITTDGLSFFDVFLKMPTAQDWSDYDAIRFKVKATSTGTPTGSRTYARLYARLDNNGVRPTADANLFGDDDRVWQANNLDVTKNDGWYTFELNFDKVAGTGGTSAPQYHNAAEYNVEGYPDPEVSGAVARNSLESFRLATYLKNSDWIGTGETLIIYFDDIELLDRGIALPSKPGMWVEPHAGSVKEGESIFVDVKISADDVYGVEFDLDFDKTLVEVVGITVGSMWPGVEGTDHTVIEKTYNNGIGIIEFSAYLLNPQPEMDVVAGQVARIEFVGLAAGTSDLDLNDALGSTKEAAPIDFTLEDGTLEVLGTGSVEGIVEVQGRFGPDWDGAQVTVSGGPCGGDSYSFPVTSADGTWSISGLAAGIYDVAVEMPLYLDGLKTGQSVTDGGSLDVGQVKVLGGDSDDSDGASPCVSPGGINVTDASFIATDFGKTTSFDVRADINDDGKVNILDASLLGGNWGKCSPVPWL